MLLDLTGMIGINIPKGVSAITLAFLGSIPVVFMKPSILLSLTKSSEKKRTGSAARRAEENASNGVSAGRAGKVRLNLYCAQIFW